MNIKMTRNENNTTTYLINKDGATTPFDYISMIKLLYSERIIGETQFDGEFSENEIACIRQMVDKIAKTVVPAE